MNASARVLLVRAKLAVRVLKRRSAETPLTQSALQVGVLGGAMRCCLARHGGRGVFAGWVARHKKSRHRIGERCRLKSRLSLGGLAWMERSYFRAKL